MEEHVENGHPDEGEGEDDTCGAVDGLESDSGRELDDAYPLVAAGAGFVLVVPGDSELIGCLVNHSQLDSGREPITQGQLHSFRLYILVENRLHPLSDEGGLLVREFPIHGYGLYWC